VENRQHTDIEHKLHNILVKIQVALEQLGFDRELQDSIEECLEMIRTKQYNVAVIGEFKRGKSTIINALLGAAILPADINPMTATINRVTYGSEQGAVVKFKDGSEKKIGIGELEEYVTKITTESEKRAATVSEAVVYYPTVFCQNNIDIIDTPGLNDNDKMTEITLSILDSIDAVIVPIAAKSPVSKTEIDLVCKLISKNDIDNIVFVINRMDELDKDEYVYETFLEKRKIRIQTGVMDNLKEIESSEELIAKAHRLLDNIIICGISAKMALESFVTNNNEKRKESRWEEFLKVLMASVTSKKIFNIFNKTINTIKRTISEIGHQDEKRREYFKNKTEEILSGESAIMEYAGNTDRIIDRVFEENDEKLTKVTEEADEYKQLIKEIFITELSAVRENGNMNASIRAALEKARAEAFKTVGQKGLNKRIYDVFSFSAGQLFDYREKKIGGLIKRLAGSCSGNTGGGLTQKSLTAFAESALMKNEIDLFDLTLPNIGDLTNINVITAVMNAANKSLDNYKSEMNRAVKAIRVNWFKQFDEDKETTQNAIKKVIKTQKDEAILQKAAYLQIYREFCENSKSILSECESISAENK